MPSPRSNQVQRSGVATVELCFNAWDDNANGLIDEGCGVAQSELQVVLAWTDARADLDLLVRDPSGGIARAGDATQAGMTLSADCPENEAGCVEQSFENAYLEADEVPSGRYWVRARLQKLPMGAQSVSATLGIRRPGATLSYELEFFAVGQEVLLDFAVPKRKGQADSGAERADQDLP